MNKDKNGIVEIDLLQVMRVIWKNMILIILVGAVCGIAVYAYTKIFVAPTYKADIMVNVNNNANLPDSKESVSTSEISASKSLVSTYIVILKSRSVVEEVIRRSGVTYPYEKVVKMISGESVSSTEIMRITVTAYSPAEAALLANTVADVLPDKLSTIIPGSSAVIVDRAVQPKTAAGPHKTKNAVLGFLVGAFLCAAIAVIRDLIDDTVRDETFLTQNFQIPLLASIPDMTERGTDSSYYSYYHPSGTSGKHRTTSGQSQKEGRA